MMEWVVSIGIVLFGVCLLAIIGFFCYSNDIGLAEFIGIVCVGLFLIALVIAVHGGLYGGGK